MIKQLNIVYVGSATFPIGLATTKRRRYMVDYLNKCNIECHILITMHKNSHIYNETDGFYGMTEFHDISFTLDHYNYLFYLKKGKEYLRKWYNSSKKNIIIFMTTVDITEYPFYRFAQNLGYKIIFDQVETKDKFLITNASFKRKIHIWINNPIIKKTYSNCDGSFVISQALKEENEKSYPDMPLCILQNSTPILQKSQKNKFSEIPSILYSGTFASKDGVKYLIEAFNKIRNQGVNCRLVLTGKGTVSDMKILDEVIKRNDVDYLGFVNDEKLKEIQRSCDILTMTRDNSKFANFGFPFKLSEYLSTGNPVIASNVSDIELYLKHKESAYLVQPENSDEIATGIKFLINNQKEALAIGQRGLEQMKKHFSIDSVGEKFVNFLQSIK